MIKRLLAIAFILGSVFPAYAELKVFLYPRCASGDTSVLLSEIAWVEGDSEISPKARRVSFDRSMFIDGFLDAREVRNELNSQGYSDVVIVGNAVRIVKPDTAAIELERLAVHAVKRGDSVKVFIRIKGIYAELRGKAAADALVGDELFVDVETLKKRTVKGIVRENHEVEVRL